jgi:predicted ATPase
MCVWWALFSGGPGGGKSTLVGFLSQGFREAGVRCVVVREAATAALLDGDVSALGVEGRQRAILRRSLLEQELALALARQHALHGPVFVFQDRGPLDGRAYCDPDVFAVVAATEDFDVAGALDHVDAIFHVSTAPSEAYVGPCDIARLGYNPARRECYAEAAKACELHAREYQSHAGYARIENGADAMRGKLVAVLAMIEAQVTEPLRVAVSKAAALALRAYDVSKQTVQPCPTYTVLDRLVRLQFEALTTPREALFPVFGHSATHLAGKLRLYDSNMLTLWSTLDMGNCDCFGGHGSLMCLPCAVGHIRGQSVRIVTNVQGTQTVVGSEWSVPPRCPVCYADWQINSYIVAGVPNGDVPEGQCVYIRPRQPVTLQ